ncbi:MAG: DUF4911 domain-containing protein [Negativicutes bacterium]|jgi:hypothetical protein|nr:DUF4911 domain-containing protein [Negativicutes bacterium]MBP8628921.1 DUF4911 domain-containing protein [Negativicutes bacterium]MBP9948578.1 DUF4911 domain-containing protein [Negativicutes bacterium]
MKTEIFLKVNKEDINYINRIMEGYEYLGVVSTIDKKEGIIVIRTTTDMYDEAKVILENLEIDFQYL